MIRRVRTAALLGVVPASLCLVVVAFAGDADQPFQVPEPSSLVLLATGFGVLGWALRRRR